MHFPNQYTLFLALPLVGLLVASWSSLIPASAQTELPPNLNPGAINNQVHRDIFLQQEAMPYWHEPIPPDAVGTPKSDESLIEMENIEVKGKIAPDIPPTPPPDEINVVK